MVHLTTSSCLVKILFALTAHTYLNKQSTSQIDVSSSTDRTVPFISRF